MTDEPSAQTALRPSPRLVTVTDADAGRRVDNFLGTQLKGVPRTRLYRMLRRGEVRVNGRRVGPDHRLLADDTVRLPPVFLAEGSQAEPPLGLAEALDARVLHEDELLLVIDKPAGIPVHGGTGLAFGVIETLRRHRPRGFLELVHRLDRGTSGCLVLAKDARALRALQRAFAADGVDKRYKALVAGDPAGRAWRVDAPLARAEGGGMRQVQVDFDLGRPARSHFTVESRWPSAALVDVAIDTGRTHQIRVHAAWSGHPVAGDERYGDDEANARFAALGLRRTFLHAAAIHLPAPLGGSPIHCTAPLPRELAVVLERLAGARPQPGAIPS